MLRAIYRLFGIGKLPGGVLRKVPGERVLLEAEGVTVAKHFSGHVPGQWRRGDGREYRLGAFVITNARVLATIGRAMIVNAPFNRAVDDGPTTVSLERDGLHVTWDLDRLHEKTGGVLALHFRHEVTKDFLAGLPFTSVRFPADAQAVVRLTGSLSTLPGA